MRYTPTLITALVTIAALSPTHTAFARPSQQARALVSHVAKQQGRRLTVQGAAVTRLSPGMSVWISEPGPGGAGGLPIVEAKVQFVHGQQAVVLLPEGAPNIPPRAVVEPRFVAEARLYGQKADVQRPEAETVKPPEPDYRTWHQRP